MQNRRHRLLVALILIGLLVAQSVALPAVPVSAAPAYPDMFRTLQFEALLGGPTEFADPEFLSTDSNQNLYVSDPAANRVFRYDANGTFVRAYGTGASGTANGDVPYPTGVVVIGNTIYVADRINDRVQRYDLATGSAISSFAFDNAGNEYGMAAGPDGNLYVVDQSQSRIEVYTTAGAFVRSFGVAGSANGQFNLPYDIAFDSLGYVYVTDLGNGRVQKFSQNGTFIRAFNGGVVVNPLGLHIDRADTIWVTDLGANRVFRFDQKGNLIGQVNAAIAGINSQPGGNQNPYSVVVLEPAGRQQQVYISDTITNWVSRFRPTATPLAHTYQAGWGSSFGVNFLDPAGIAVDKHGNVYAATFIADRVFKFDRYGNFLQSIGEPADLQFNGPVGLALDDINGLLYVTYTGPNRVRVFTTSGAFVRQWGGTGSGNGQLSIPQGLALDAAGFVYVADSGNDRIQKFDSYGNYVTKWGTSGTGLGQIDNPIGIAVDSARGLVYVSEFNNDRIQVFTTTGTPVAIYASSTSGPGQLSDPIGLALDGRGSLYVADRGNNRIVQFDMNGNYLTAFGTVGTGNGQFSEPNNIAIDPATGQIYITERGNDRVQRFGSPNVKADRVGIFRPSNRTFFLRLTNSTGPANIQSNASAWTLSTDLAVAGDWNGDGIDTVGVYRQSNGTFYLSDNNRATGPHYTIPFGAPGDLPVVGDWDGDGQDGIGVYRPSQSQFYLKNIVEPGPADLVMTLGASGDRPVAGDWNSDGQDTVGVYRPSQSRFFLSDQYLPFGTLTAGYNILLGNPNDVGFAGDWIEQGFSGIGVFRPTNGITFLKNALTSGFADVNMVYGIAGDAILGGEWGVVPGESTPPAAPSDTAPESAPEFGASGSREGMPGR